MYSQSTDFLFWSWYYFLSSLVCTRNVGSSLRRRHRKLSNLLFYNCQQKACMMLWRCTMVRTLQWRHNERSCVSNYQRLDGLLNRWRRSKKISKPRVTSLCERNPPVIGWFPHKGPVTQTMFPFDDVIMFCKMELITRSRRIPNIKDYHNWADVLNEKFDIYSLFNSRRCLVINLKSDKLKYLCHQSPYLKS